MAKWVKSISAKGTHQWDKVGGRREVAVVNFGWKGRPDWFVIQKSRGRDIKNLATGIRSRKKAISTARKFMRKL